MRLKQYRDNASATITRASSWDYNHPDYPGLLWKEYLSDGTTSTQYTYDAGGRPGLVSDFNGKQTAYGYDVFDHVRSSTPEGAPATVIDYDRQGNLSAVTDPSGNQTRYVYDDLGRLNSETSPDRGLTRYGYDPAGNPAWKIDARNLLTTYGFDNLYRPTAANFPAFGDRSAYSVGYTYDQRANGKGHLTGISDLSGTTDLDSAGEG